MNAMECLLTRRSIRKYKSDPIPREVLEELLEGACWAPSGTNYQPWYFVALTDPADLDRLRDVMHGVTQKMEYYLNAKFKNHPEVVRDTTSFLYSLGGAPVCIVAFLQREYPMRDTVVESVAAAIQNLLLLAWEKGIGSCWVNAASDTGRGNEIAEAFAPGKGEFLSLVTLGYPERVPAPPARKPGRYVIV